jgi:hypothetical protein
MKKLHLLSWDNFCSSIIVEGEQRVHRVSESPLVELFSDGIDKKIGIWIQLDAAEIIPPEMQTLSVISIRTFTRESCPALEVASSAPQVRRQFYHFAVAVAERIVIEKARAIDAVASELQSFAVMLEEKSLLAIQQQLGLLGELLVLERLAARDGPAALDAWVGPQAEPHDFRIDDREYEVKTTITSRRVHTINGDEQLVPSKDCSLFLVSIVLAPAGKSKGFSLPDKADAVCAHLASMPSRLNQFFTVIKQAGLSKEEYPLYARRYALRRPFAVVPINQAFPTLTRREIRQVLGDASKRIEALHYNVNVEGLEIEEGQPGFADILPL